MDAPRFHQVVPRPSEVARSEPRRWLSDVHGDTVPPIPLDRLCGVLAPQLLPPENVPGISSAVLIAFFEYEGSSSVLLTRRAATLRAEPLTVSFPGGRREGDESPLDTALREAEEEIGLDRSHVTLIGTLPVIERRSAEFVLPVVARLAPGFTVRANPSEVAAILEVPVQGLLALGASWTEQWGTPESGHQIAFFAHEGDEGADVVWGLTARMLWEILELVVLGLGL